MITKIKHHYDKIAKQYQSFYSTDLYSVKENEAIANFIRNTIPKKFLNLSNLSIGDFGCGAGLPRVIWNSLFKKRGMYDGYDVSKGMLNVAARVYGKEIQEKRVAFHHEEISKVVRHLPDKKYNLIFFLHGVPSYFNPKLCLKIFSQIPRILDGYGIFGFLSRYAYNRSPQYPKSFLHKDRRLDCDPLKVHTYTSEEIKEQLTKCGFEIVAIRGMNIIGGIASIHESFIERHRRLQRRKDKGIDVLQDFKQLEHEIDAVINSDSRLGKIYPDSGHDLLVIVRHRNS